MIHVPNRDDAPKAAGQYLVRLKGSPLFLVAYWSPGTGWLRGATKIYGGPAGWAGPIQTKGKGDE